MDFEGAVEYFRGLEGPRYRFRLENTRDLLFAAGFEYLGEIVHVAGTNGKGSCACVIEKILERSGRKVGLYTSPHLIDFTERIRVCGEQIREDRFAELAQMLSPYIEDMDDKPTFFEATTALALLHFAYEDVDSMVLEVGMGGRLDATNAVQSRFSLITNVELDHTQYLGSTVEEIAYEKAGIVGDGSTLVTAADGVALDVLRKRCEEVGATSLEYGCDFRAKDVKSSLDGTYMTVEAGSESMDVFSPMRGRFQAVNAACAAQLTKSMGVDSVNIVAGIGEAYWPARLDLIQENPKVILDSAHNPAGMAESLAFIRKSVNFNRLIVVCGFLKDKDYGSMTKMLSAADVLVATNCDAPRALPASEILSKLPPSMDACAFDDVAQAVEHALAVAEADDLVLVTGSIYVAGEAIKRWRKRIGL